MLIVVKAFVIWGFVFHLPRATVVADLIKTFWQARVTRRIQSGDDNDKVALIPMMGGIHAIKQESLFAWFLRRRGWNIVVLLRYDLPFVYRVYYWVFGLTTFVKLSDMPLNDLEVDQVKEAVEDFSSRVTSFREIKEWSYRGSTIGSAILSMVQRKGRLSSIDIEDIDVQAKIKERLTLVLGDIHRNERLLSTHCPDLILLIEPNGLNRSLIALCVARKIDVVTFVQPYREDAYILKRINKKTFGVHPNSIEEETLKVYGPERRLTREEDQALEQDLVDRYNGRWVLQERNQPVSDFLSAAQLRSMYGWNEKSKVAVIFSHILWDANLFFGVDIFDDYSEWLVETVKAAIQNERINWMVKLHPANVWKKAIERDESELAEIILLQKHGLLPLPSHVRLVRPADPISTWALYHGVDYGITVRGTCGIELPCFGIPTLTAGTGRYSNRGFTVDSNTREEYLERLLGLDSCPRMRQSEVDLARIHAYFIFHRRPFVVSGFKTAYTDQHRLDGLQHNLELKLTARGLDKVSQNANDFANWIEDKKRPVDFVS